MTGTNWKPTVGDVVWINDEVRGWESSPLRPKMYWNEPWEITGITPGANDSQWLIIVPLNHPYIHFAGETWLRYDPFLTAARRANAAHAKALESEKENEQKKEN